MMVKDKYIHKFYAFALAAVFALTLAGCGGGSGGGTAMTPTDPPVVEPEPDPEPTPEEIAAEEEAAALAAAQEAAMAAYMAAMAAVGGAVDPVAMAAAQAQADMAKGASDAAAMATTSEMAGEYQMKAEMYRDMAMEAAGDRGLGITTLANAAANQAAIDSARLVGVAVPAPISNAGRVGRAMGGAAAADALTPGSGEDGEGMANHQGAVAIVSASDTGSGPRFTLSATPVDDSNAANNAATSLDRGETPTSFMTRGGIAGAELVASAPNTATTTGYRQNAIVFTDINPPAQTYHGQFLADGSTDNPRHYTAVELGGEPATPTDLGLVNTAIVTGDVPGDGSHFVGTLNPSPTDNTPPFGGRFFCPAMTACSISVDASGVLRGITGYTFQRTVAGTVMRGDSDYMAWGVWIHVPNAVPGVTTVRTNPATVAAFSSGSAPFQVPAALTGTATYNGVANGLYAAGGMVEYFEADATLEADFGGRTGNDATPTIDGSDRGLLGAVTGSISNIKAGGMDVEGSITLGRAPLIAGDDADVTDGITDATLPATRFNGNTQGTLGGRAMTGSWTGQFYGPNRAQGVAIRSEFPTGAAGTFGAATPAGAPAVRILGSFGAHRQ